MPTPDIDINRARAETPACAELAHFNNAGAALNSSGVLKTQIEHLELEARIGGYEAHAREADRIEGIYESVAQMIGASRPEIALVDSNTTALDLFVYSIHFGPGDRILTTVTEYGANYVAYLHIAQRTGAVIDVVPSTATGEIDVAALETMVDERVKLITINHVPTNSGLVNPAAEVGRVAKSHGIPFLLDASQSAGQIPLEVDTIGCDALTATGRKFLRGPRGTGFLYVRRSLIEKLEPPMLDHDSAPWVAPDRYEIRPDAGRFEHWEKGYASLLGLGRAVDEAMEWGLDAIERRITMLARTLRSRLEDDIPDAAIHDIGRKQCGIVTFSLGRRDLPTVKAELEAQRINVSIVPPASALLDQRARDLPPMLRASVHIYNTEEEFDRLITALSTISG